MLFPKTSQLLKPTCGVRELTTQMIPNSYSWWTCWRDFKLWILTCDIYVSYVSRESLWAPYSPSQGHIRTGDLCPLLSIRMQNSGVSHYNPSERLLNSSHVGKCRHRIPRQPDTCVGLKPSKKPKQPSEELDSETRLLCHWVPRQSLTSPGLKRRCVVTWPTIGEENWNLTSLYSLSLCYYQVQAEGNTEDDCQY